MRIPAFLAAAAAMPAAPLGGCTAGEPEAPASEAFVIRGLGVAFGPYDPATNTAGDFPFVEGEQKLFLEFGAVVAAEGGGTKALPTFEYRLRPDAPVRAIADGLVTRFAFQEDTRDYEFCVRSSQDPAFEVGYDHVLHPTVDLGDTVRAGDVLGNPGTWSSRLGRFEIMVNNTATGRSYCPLLLVDPAIRSDCERSLSRFMSDWETFRHDPGLYDEQNHVCPGCRVESMATD